MHRSRGTLAIAAAAAMTVAGLTSSSALAVDKYFDLNDVADGSGITTAGPHAWNTTSTFWNTDPLGGAAGAVGTWADGDSAFFSAGTDGTGAYTVNLGAARTATGLTVEEGAVNFTGSAIALNTGTARINSGASVTVPSVFNITQTAGSGGLLLDGGTMRHVNTATSGGSTTFWDSDGAIRLTGNGGTVHYAATGTAVVGIYGGAAASATIIRDPSVPAGTLVTLTKTGPQEFRYQGLGLATSTYDKLVVAEGQFRLGFNSSIQDERGFGAVPAEFLPDQITLQNNAILGNSFTLATLHQNRGITLGVGGGQLSGNYSIPGAITGVGSLTRAAGGLTLNGVNTYTGGFIQNVAGTTTVGATGTLAGPTSTVTLTLGTIALNNTAQTIGGIGGVTGGTLALSAGHSLTINTAPAANLSYAGVISGATATVTKDGTGTQTLANANTYGGGTTVNGGVLVAAHADAFNTGAALAVNAGGTARIQKGLANALDVGTLTVAATGRVDLNDGALVKRNASGAAGQTATQQINAALKTGLENGGNFDWLGNGISSTEANADNATAGSVLYGLGVVQNNLASAGAPDGTTTDETPGNTIYTSFKGRTVALNDTLVRYTYMGDADLSGNIDGTDYSLIDAGFGAALSGWINGDFDYSGAIDGTDYALIDNAFGAQTGVIPDQVEAMIALHTAQFGQEYVDALSAIQAVPEPGTLGVLALAGAGLLARRRRVN